MEPEKYLCQLNIAGMKTSMTDPSMKDFVDALAYINGLAEGHPGFVWRLKDETTGAAYTIKPFGEDILVNMSIWENAESLRDFVYKSHHKDYLRRKAEWFDKMSVYQVLWWVPKGHIPNVEEAKQKLELLKEKGPTPEAFGFAEALRSGKKNEAVSLVDGSR